MVRSFRRIGISKIDDDPPLYNVELDDTDCFEFHNPALLSYGVQMEFEDLALMLGHQEAIEIRQELQTTIEVFRDRDASPQHLPEHRWNYTPLIRELSAHLSREDFTQKLAAMVGELQDQAILDSDFKIS